jgi:hypothetical protein
MCQGASRTRPANALLAVLAVSVFAALPASAQAGTRADYQQKFTTALPGTSTGTDTRIVYKHPDDPEAKPIPVRREVFTFPKGTRFDGSVVPDCTASDLELQVSGPAACPAESQVGSGHDGTFMTGFPGSGETPMDLDMFDAQRGFIVVGSPSDNPMLRQVGRATREGRVVTVNAPRMPGGPPEGESALRRIHNVFDARSAGDRAYVRTPRTCPRSGSWKFKLRLVWADGVKTKHVDRMPCRGGSGAD